MAGFDFGGFAEGLSQGTGQGLSLVDRFNRLRDDARKRQQEEIVTQGAQELTKSGLAHTDPEAFTNKLADLYLSAGLPEKAFTYTQQAIQFGKDKDQKWALEGQAAAEAGNAPLAIQRLNQLNKHRGSTDTYNLVRNPSGGYTITGKESGTDVGHTLANNDAFKQFTMSQFGRYILSPEKAFTFATDQEKAQAELAKTKAEVGGETARTGLITAQAGAIPAQTEATLMQARASMAGAGAAQSNAATNRRAQELREQGFPLEQAQHQAEIEAAQARTAAAQAETGKTQAETGILTGPEGTAARAADLAAKQAQTGEAIALAGATRGGDRDQSLAEVANARIAPNALPGVELEPKVAQKLAGVQAVAPGIFQANSELTKDQAVALSEQGLTDKVVVDAKADTMTLPSGQTIKLGVGGGANLLRQRPAEASTTTPGSVPVPTALPPRVPRGPPSAATSAGVAGAAAAGTGIMEPQALGPGTPRPTAITPQRAKTEALRQQQRRQLKGPVPGSELRGGAGLDRLTGGGAYGSPVIASVLRSALGAAQGPRAATQSTPEQDKAFAEAFGLTSKEVKAIPAPIRQKLTGPGRSPSGPTQPQDLLDVGGGAIPRPFGGGADAKRPNAKPEPVVAPGLGARLADAAQRFKEGGIAGLLGTEGIGDQMAAASGKFQEVAKTKGLAAAMRDPEANRLATDVAGNFDFTGLIKAFHGSPHLFDRFDIDKIGSGEGAQVYGYGLYFAENPGIGEYYRRTLTRQSPELKNLRKEMLDAGMAWDQAVQERGKYLLNDPGYAEAVRKNTEARDKYLNMTTKFNEAEKNVGHTYQVDLDVEPQDLLDWNKPLNQQSPKVQKVLEPMVRRSLALSQDQSGESFYRQLTHTFSGLDYEKRQAAASKVLEEAGIPGIRYLDSNSRTGKDNKYNLVMFGDKGIKITKREAGGEKPASAVTPRSVPSAPLPPSPLSRGPYTPPRPPRRWEDWLTSRAGLAAAATGVLGAGGAAIGYMASNAPSNAPAARPSVGRQGQPVIGAKPAIPTPRRKPLQRLQSQEEAIATKRRRRG